MFPFALAGRRAIGHFEGIYCSQKNPSKLNISKNSQHVLLKKFEAGYHCQNGYLKHSKLVIFSLTLTIAGKNGNNRVIDIELQNCKWNDIIEH